MRIGVLGGTFDPPHYGHLVLAEQTREQLSLERVLWVPAADPPHKQGQSITPITHRLEMLRLALADNPAFEISLVDVERPGPHYTVDMLALIATQNPAAELFFLMGIDSVRDLPTWYNPSRLIQQATLATMRRPDVTCDLDELESAIPGLSDNLIFVDAPQLEISSDDIRAHVAGGRTIRYLTPVSVEAYLRKHGLYASSSR